MEVTGLCEYCGIEYIKAIPRRRFCSNQCSQIGVPRRRKLDPLSQGQSSTCEECGGTYVRNNRRQRFCSMTCSNKVTARTRPARPGVGRAETYRQYRARNVQARRDATSRWRVANLDRVADYARAWRQQNPEKLAVNLRAYYDKNSARLRAVRSIRYGTGLNAKDLPLELVALYVQFMKLKKIVQERKNGKAG